MDVSRLSFLAPMAGLTDNPGFLRSCIVHGCDVVVLPMVFFKHATRNWSSVESWLELALSAIPAGEHGRSVVLQVIGRSGGEIEQALDRLGSFDLAGINLNLGCPSRKMQQLGVGAAMIDVPADRDGVISALVKHSMAPCSVKIRLVGGARDTDIEGTLDVCQVLDSFGLDWIAVHGRTLPQGYSGKADWEVIKKIKETCSTPVVGNGDLATATEGLEKVDLGCCDGFMIGRAALFDPRVFSMARDGQCFPEKTIDDALRFYVDHVSFIEGLAHPMAPGLLSLHEHKRWLLYFTKGIAGGKKLRGAIASARSKERLDALLDSISI